ncbi:DUF771 domain-containing protein [Atopobacter sp. AH10]|uniref:DUF771 domain-containing protein n=1 Tax=Atopobacter sp. AH10 TaxID=2315861 RepID=UPI000EF1CB11|nr:DUF771 domain-containing protein [Atopobacter sp. AH10]RLK63176.1 DUF771 domain-containing protein [Atopobacter sp. AH10]
MELAELFEMEKQVQAKEYEKKLAELEKQLEIGSVGDSKWACEMLGIKTFAKIKELVLYPFRNELEGEIVFFSDTQGIPWRFNKYKFRHWVDENFKRIEWK